jgi:hypothetical protein
MRHRIIFAVVPLVVLSGCGQHGLRTAVVAPSTSIARLQGPGNYVYVGHPVSTTGTIRRARGEHGSITYVLSDGAGHAVALLPANVATRDAGRRVQVTGIFDVRFELGPQLTVQRIQIR